MDESRQIAPSRHVLPPYEGLDGAVFAKFPPRRRHSDHTLIFDNNDVSVRPEHDGSALVLALIRLIISLLFVPSLPFSSGRHLVSRRCERGGVVIANGRFVQDKKIALTTKSQLVGAVADAGRA